MTWVLVRRRNLNSVILDEDEFEDDIENAEIGISSKNHSENNEYDMKQNDNYEPIEVTNSLSDDYEEDAFATGAIPSDEKPMDRRAFTLDDEDVNHENEIKRRSGRIQRNAEGPIMSTKRKRLDGKLDIPGQQFVSKKVNASKVKTRKVSNPVKVRKVRSVKKED